MSLPACVTWEDYVRNEATNSHLLEMFLPACVTWDDSVRNEATNSHLLGKLMYFCPRTVQVSWDLTFVEEDSVFRRALAYFSISWTSSPSHYTPLLFIYRLCLLGLFFVGRLALVYSLLAILCWISSAYEGLWTCWIHWHSKTPDLQWN